jgi:hypothetical protein
VGLIWRIQALRYAPFQEHKNVVWSKARQRQKDWPYFALDHLAGCGPPQAYAERDTLILSGFGPAGHCGNQSGVFHFGELCLNIGWEPSTGSEFNLESSFGFGGVSGPVEVRLTTRWDYFLD